VLACPAARTGRKGGILILECEQSRSNLAPLQFFSLSPIASHTHTARPALPHSCPHAIALRLM